MGIDKYIDQQLHPELISDAATDIRLEPFDSIRMSLAEIFAHYADPQMVQQQINSTSRGQNNADPAAMRQQVQQQMQNMGILPPQRLIQDLSGQKIVRAVSSERQLQEVLTDFWYNHFNVFINKGADRFLTTDYEMNAIRPHVLGKFKDLLMATAKSPAMMFYLDNVQSTVPDPRALAIANAQRGGNARPNARPNQGGINENYARELMELHTMGVDGGYTQQDVQDVARALTGWSIAQPQDADTMANVARQTAQLRLGAQPGQRGEFMFRPFMHDTGPKTVLGHTIKAGGGIEDGEQVIDILAHHPSTAHFIATKLVRRFHSDVPPESLVNRVADTFMKSDGDIRAMMRVILTSPEFNSSEAYQAKMKSPFELAVSSIRMLNGRSDGSPQIIQAIERMGQPLYRFDAPTGFPDRASYWMNNGAVIERINFGIALTTNRIPGTRIDLKAIPMLRLPRSYWVRRSFRRSRLQRFTGFNNFKSQTRVQYRHGGLAMKMKAISLAALLGLGLVITSPLSAHHSFQAEYDQSKPLTLVGKVIRVLQENPTVGYTSTSGTHREKW
jgi:uncharacterized protein (DUF1800 family)